MSPRVIATILLLSGVLWLAVPAVASADNCGAATTAELKFKDCYDRLKNTVAGWMAATAGAVAGFMAAFAKATMKGDGVPQFNWSRDEKGDLVGRFDKEPIQPMDLSGMKGPCVLTTACVTALGKPDDCHELEMFRHLRDEYLSRNADGIAVIEDYYQTAPGVVAAVEAEVDADAAWHRIYAGWVAPVVELVDGDRIDEAVSLALSRYEAIKREYRVS